ncbi:hypothetical protein MKEN_01205300 [Mycena kentingensis (nom. inval.)]|nr:hypothetical protein MKEN_01205300 [Mycena kentingensis (nom. inval.)]
MNLGLGGYGSDSDNESDHEVAPARAGVSKTVPAAPLTKKRAPKKITIGLPALVADERDDLDDDRPPAKKARLETGAGRSSLLSMLPAPKEKNPALPPPQRTLGGGAAPALTFTASGSETQKEADSAIAFRPASLAKGRTNVSVEESSTNKPALTTRMAVPAVDFFSLGPFTNTVYSLYADTHPGNPSTSSSASTVSTSTPHITASSAPSIPTFDPPEPTPNDPYPGYYTLPSGTWAAYEPAYYAKFTKKWQAEYDAHVRALEKGTAKGFEEVDRAEVTEVDAAKEMERAKREVQELEARKAITAGIRAGPAEPSIKLTQSKSSRIANTRHQLATMLHQAYSNREALEEKIAEGKRNRKEAGNKYGF